MIPCKETHPEILRATLPLPSLLFPVPRLHYAPYASQNRGRFLKAREHSFLFSVLRLSKGWATRGMIPVLSTRVSHALDWCALCGMVNTRTLVCAGLSELKQVVSVSPAHDTELPRVYHMAVFIQFFNYVYFKLIEWRRIVKLKSHCGILLITKYFLATAISVPPIPRAERPNAPR